MSVLDKIYENEDFDGFTEIDRAYYKGKKFEGHLMEYIKSHPAEFAVNGDFPYSEFEF